MMNILVVMEMVMEIKTEMEVSKIEEIKDNHNKYMFKMDK